MKVPFFAFLILFLISPFLSYGYLPPEVFEDMKSNRSEEDLDRISQLRANCQLPVATAELNINNVRAKFMGGADLWWDSNDAGYFVPNTNDPISSIFAGAIWIGGYDEEGNLKLAANDYRSGFSNDFWPGPLGENSGGTDPELCDNWDRFFKVTFQDVEVHRSNIKEFLDVGEPYPEELIPDNIKYWPAKGNPYFTDRYDFELPNSSQGLAPFFDFLGNGIYNPSEGDFPVLGLEGCDVSPNSRVPDEMLFWVFNDAGGHHTNTGGNKLNMEFRAQAFAFQSNDELNEMSFYRFEMVNRNTQSLDSTYFGLWIDPDLGCPFDDYIGTNPELDLMFTYNKDEMDGSEPGNCNCPTASGPISTYCEFIPAIGVDFLRGPLDENGEYLGLSHFIYYNNPFGFGGSGAMTDPSSAGEFYSYLSGSWRDGNPITEGGSGYQVFGGTPTNHVFPDPPNDPEGWSMCTDSIQQADRRTLMSSGSFRMDPGAVNEIIFGVVWVPDLDYPCPDLTRLFYADRRAKSLFNSCFELEMRGPDAPNMHAEFKENSFRITLKNDLPESNNANLEYEEKGTFLPDGIADDTYVFEGYQVFQLRDHTVEPTRENLENSNLARVVFQSDIENEIDLIYNWKPHENPNNPLSRRIYTPLPVVDGENRGLKNSFTISRDLFAEIGDDSMKEGEVYYYTVVAYAHNNYKNFDWRNPEVGQRTPYLESSRNVNVYRLTQPGTAELPPEERTPDISDDNSFLVFFGNPSLDDLRFYLEDEENRVWELVVRNKNGQEVYRDKIGAGSHLIYAGHWPAGSYYVDVFIDRTSRISEQWIKL